MYGLLGLFSWKSSDASNGSNRSDTPMDASMDASMDIPPTNPNTTKQSQTIETQTDLKYIIPIEELNESNITEYVIVDEDPNNAYHKLLFDDIDFNQKYDTPDAAIKTEQVQTTSVEHYTGHAIDPHDFYDFCDAELEYLNSNNPVILAMDMDSDGDTRNRKGESTKSDYRTSNSLVKTHCHDEDITIESNVDKIVAKGSAYYYRNNIANAGRIPITVIRNEFPFDIEKIDNFHGHGIGSHRWGYNAGDIGSSVIPKIIEALEKHAIEKNTHTTLKSGQVYNIYEYKVPIIGWLDTEPVKSAPSKFDDYTGRSIYKVCHQTESVERNGVIQNITVIHSVQKYAEFVEAVLPNGFCPIEFKCSVSTSAKRKHAIKIVRSQQFDPDENKMIDIGGVALDRSNYWEADHNESAHVVLDFGSNTKVTHISTMGAPPPIEAFPTNRWCEKFDESYDGPTTTNQIYVLRERTSAYSYGGAYLHQFDQHSFGKWVTSYDMFGRKDGGKWIKIGNYKGNTDSYTEVVHDIRPDLNGETFRYLKIVPVSFHRKIAMKIDAFGRASDVSKISKIDKTHVIYTVTSPDTTLMKGRHNALIRKTFSRRDSWDLNTDQIALDKKDRLTHIRNEIKEYESDRSKYLKAIHKTKDLHYLKYEQNADKIRQDTV